MCDTPFQIMMAVAFRMTILQDETVELIVSDIISNAEILYKNILNSGIFDKTYFLKDYEIDYGKHSGGELGTLHRLIHRKKIISSLLPLRGKVDAFYSSDTLPSIEWIYDKLLSDNPDLNMYFYEEGPISVLCDQGKHFRQPFEYSTSGLNRLLDSLLNIKHINGHYNGAFTSVGNYMSPSYFPWMEIPKISTSNLKAYISILNGFWNYQKSDILKNKVVFLEESFYTDGRENRDMEILNDLIKVLGKDRILVKMHPRTRINRYEKIGVSVYQNTSVPWELLALNGDLDRTLLVCIGSGAAIHPKLYWNIDQSSIALLDCKEYHYNYLDNKYYRLYSKICAEKGLAYLPKNKREFFDLLENNK